MLNFCASSKVKAIVYEPENCPELYFDKNELKEFNFTTIKTKFECINDLGTDSKKYQHIFNKGDNTYNSGTNLSSVNNAPGVYLGPANNNLHIIIDTVDGSDTNNVIDIDNIPIRKWVNVAIRMQNLIVDVYINGTVSSRLILNNTPKQNYNDVYICQNGGFSGKLSNLRYYTYALNVFEINNVVLGGPNLRVTDNLSKTNEYTYLSNSWYTSKL
jgi:hypothetical protein